MPFLAKEDIRKLILSDGLVSGYSDVDSQLTANGFDFRLCAVIEITRAGKLAVEKKNNVAPELGEAWVLGGFEDRLAGYKVAQIHSLAVGDTVNLNPLKPYYVISIESLKTPTNLMTKFQARTSLFRFAQGFLEATFGEAGYNGYLTFLLMNTIEGGQVELGARFAQVAFAQLSGEADYSLQKETNYQGGKIF